MGMDEKKIVINLFCCISFCCTSQALKCTKLPLKEQLFLSRNHWLEARSLESKIKSDSHKNLRRRRVSIISFLNSPFSINYKCKF
jgi:hypothetical protein